MMGRELLDDILVVRSRCSDNPSSEELRNLWKFLSERLEKAGPRREFLWMDSTIAGRTGEISDLPMLIASRHIGASK
jgi:hypothetical protein